jgi:chorismate-pyruvate lyase
MIAPVFAPVFIPTLASVVSTAGSPSERPRSQIWPGDIIGRAESLAALQSLEILLLTRDSATLVLDDWCADHHLAAPGSKIVADRDPTIAKTPTAEQRRRLGVSDDEPIRYRRVRLRCGSHVLSEADNWYVPSRLTPQMNAALDGSDTPFGRVVQPLHFRRQTVSARLLWSPLPAGWDASAPIPRGAPALDIPPHVIENRALLVTAAGTPISEVVETYTREVLAFAPPARQD